MKIAVPLANGLLAMHFGHCQQFALVDVDDETKQITQTSELTPPPHEPGVLPMWLHEQGADVIIAGGMGNRAQSLFAQNGIQVVVGASPERIHWTVDQLKTLGIKRLAPMHCTGLAATARLWDAFPGAFVQCSVGTSLEFELA